MDKEKRLIPKSRDFQRREKEKDLKNIEQKRELDNREINRSVGDRKLSNDAFEDKYMYDDYAKVKESNITHHEDVTRLNGTWFYNQSLKNNNKEADE